MNKMEQDDTISRHAAIDALTDENIIEHLDSVYDSELHRFKRATERIIAQLPSAQPERSLRFRIGEICVDESKGFISSGRAVEKIRGLLREAERRQDETD